MQSGIDIYTGISNLSEHGFGICIRVVFKNTVNIL